MAFSDAYLFYRSDNNNPYYNLALEEYLFNNYGNRFKIFMLWQNANSIIVGKNQNTEAEINQLFVTENDITVARRLSGGGAVYHDLGNLNFTFIVPTENNSFDFSLFTQPIISTLLLFNIKAETSSRNDITINGKKFSGNAQYTKKGITMHHGTLLFDSDLTVLQKSLRTNQDKIQAKGISSTVSLVCNLKEYLDDNVSLADFEAVLMANVLKDDYQTYMPSHSEQQAINTLQNEKYSTWQWNYGSSPKCQILKEAYIHDCGHIELHLNLNNGIIEEIYSYGDYFGNRDFSIIQTALKNCPYDLISIEQAILDINISSVFHNLSKKAFIDLLFKD